MYDVFTELMISDNPLMLSVINLMYSKYINTLVDPLRFEMNRSLMPDLVPLHAYLPHQLTL
jgi:hypothetical protein